MRSLVERCGGWLPAELAAFALLWLFGTLLVMITIPNVFRFECKSKQSEAKTNLSGIFTAEKAFFGEYATYSSDLTAVNWTPDGTPLYLYGFSHPGPGTRPAGIADYDERRKDTSVLTSGDFSRAKMHDLSGHALLPSDLPAQATVPYDRFVAGAAGDINADDIGDGAVRLDLWTIDREKRLTNLRNDCTGDEVRPD